MVNYPYTAGYKEGVEYVGAFRGTVIGEPVTQPYSLEEQAHFFEWLKPLYGTDPTQYEVQGAIGNGKTPIWSQVLNFLGEVWKSTPWGAQAEEGKIDPFAYWTGNWGLGQTNGGPFLQVDWGNPFGDFDLSGLGESFTKFGTMALIGLGLVAVIMFLK